MHNTIDVKVITPEEFDRLYDDYQKGLKELICGSNAQLMISASHKLPDADEYSYQRFQENNPEMLNIAHTLMHSRIHYSESETHTVFTDKLNSITYRLYNIDTGACTWFNKLVRDDSTEWKLFDHNLLYHQLLGKPVGFVGPIRTIASPAYTDIIQIVNIT